MIPAVAATESAADALVADIIEELASRLQAGESVDLENCVREHPECADRLRRLWPAVRVLAGLGQSTGAGASVPPAGGPMSVLGDFRLLREIGRGGMGVVYEAEQLSLGRRVALKVLPFAAVLDPRQLRRFQNEAQAAALLQHPNIVPVHAVGCDRDVHYYAMQLIPGRTLAAVIAGLRRHARLVPVAASPHRTAAFFRAAARLGIQAASALDHAHQNGVIHRDVKPANLLVDVQGKLWVADFGLAHFQGGAGLTGTGDLLGTVRYMSPEQAQALIVDHRTDVYSLGVTLYELLTLEPAFAGNDRPELLRQVVAEEPAAVRRVNPTAPVELAVIVHKAMARRPEDRYATAAALADDLQRFLDDRPILARPPTRVQRLGRWTRRHRPLAVSLGISAALLLAGGLLTLVIHAFQQRDVAEQRKQIQHDVQLGRAAALRAARAPGYRGKVFADLKAALELKVPHEDRDRIRAEVLGCLGDPIGLDPVEAPRVARRQRPKVPPIFQKLLQKSQLATSPHAVTPDGGVLAVGTYNSVVTLCDTAGHYRVMACPLGAVYELQFTPDGEILVAGCEEGVVTWAIRPGVNVRGIFRTGNVRSVAVDPSGKMVAWGGRQVELWSLGSSRPLATFELPAAAASVEFSADGKWLLAMESGRMLRGWPVRETPEKRVLFGHHASIPAIAYSPDGKTLASVSKDFSLRLWDGVTGSLRCTCAPHAGYVEAVDFSPDGKLVASGDFTGDVWLYDTRTGKQVARVRSEQARSVLAWPFRLLLLFVPLGENLGKGKSVQALHFRPPGQVWRLQFSRRGDHLAAAGSSGLVIWDVVRKGPKVILDNRREVIPAGRLPRVYDLAFHPDGDDLVFLTDKGRLFSYSLSRGEPERLLPVRSAPHLKTLHFDEAGDVFTFATARETLGVWDWRRGAMVRETKQEVFQTALGGSRWAATSSKDRKVVVYDLHGGDEVLALPPEGSDIWGLAWSPDCRRLAVGLADGGLAIWDLEEVRSRLKYFGIDMPSFTPRTVGQARKPAPRSAIS